MSKPRLFIDIDGVIYANYGGEWQVRPYVVTFTRWAEEFFDIYWLSFNSRREQVVKILYAPGQVITDWHPSTLDDRGYRVPVYQDWHPKANRAEKLVGIYNYGGLEGDWLLIEDTPPHADQIEVLDHFNAMNKWIVVPDTGADVLLELKFVLERWLKDRKIIVPYEWATRVSVDRDLCVTAEWNGYQRSGRKE
jgi:hypothetical protein